MAIKNMSFNNKMWGHMLCIAFCLTFTWNVSFFDCADTTTYSETDFLYFPETFESTATNFAIDQSNHSNLPKKSSKKNLVFAGVGIAIVAALSVMIVTYLKSKKPEIDPKPKPVDPKLDPKLKPVDPKPDPKEKPEVVEEDEEERLKALPEPQEAVYRALIKMSQALGIHDGLTLNNIKKLGKEVGSNILEDFLSDVKRQLEKETFDDGVPYDYKGKVQEKREEILKEAKDIIDSANTEVLDVANYLLAYAAEKIEGKLNVDLSDFKGIMRDLLGMQLLELGDEDRIASVRKAIKADGVDQDHIEEGKAFIKAVDGTLLHLFLHNKKLNQYLKRAEKLIDMEIQSDFDILQMIDPDLFGTLVRDRKQLATFPEPRRSIYRDLLTLCGAMDIGEGRTLHDLDTVGARNRPIWLDDFVEAALRSLERDTFDADAPEDEEERVQNLREEYLKELLQVQRLGKVEVVVVASNILNLAIGEIDLALGVNMDTVRDVLLSLNGLNVVELGEEDILLPIKEAIKDEGIDDKVNADTELFIEIFERHIHQLVELNNAAVPHLQKAMRMVQEGIPSDMDLLKKADPEKYGEKTDEFVDLVEPKQTMYREMSQLSEVLDIDSGKSLQTLTALCDKLMDVTVKNYVEEASRKLERPTFDDCVGHEDMPLVVMKRHELMAKILETQRLADPSALLVTSNILLRAAAKVETLVGIKLKELKEFLGTVRGSNAIPADDKDYIKQARDAAEKEEIEGETREKVKSFITVCDKILPMLIEHNNEVSKHHLAAMDMVNEDIPTDEQFVQQIKDEETTQ